MHSLCLFYHTDSSSRAAHLRATTRPVSSRTCPCLCDTPSTDTARKKRIQMRPVSLPLLCQYYRAFCASTRVTHLFLVPRHTLYSHLLSDCFFFCSSLSATCGCIIYLPPFFYNRAHCVPACRCSSSQSFHLWSPDCPSSMQRYQVEVLQVSPANLLASLTSVHNSAVALEAHFLRTDAVVAYTAHTRLGDGVFDVRSPHASDEVCLSISLPCPDGLTRGTYSPQRQLLATSRQLVTIGGTTRAQGACWVSLAATNAAGEIVDAASELGKVQIMWSVEALACTLDHSGATHATCSSQQRGCMCDGADGRVSTHCIHCPQHVPNGVDEGHEDRRVSAISAVTSHSRLSFASHDVAIDASKVPESRLAGSFSAVAPMKPHELFHSASAAQYQDTVLEKTDTSPPGTVSAADGNATSAVTASILRGDNRTGPDMDTPTQTPVPPFAFPLHAANHSQASVTMGVETARGTDSTAPVPAVTGGQTTATAAVHFFDDTPSPSPDRRADTGRFADHTIAALTSTNSPPDPTLPAMPCDTKLEAFSVGDNILFFGTAAPDDWRAAMSADADGHDDTQNQLNRRELNQHLLDSFPRAKVMMDVTSVQAVEVLPGPSECDPACGQGPHIDYYATSTQVGIPFSRAVKNLYTRPSPIVHLASERAEYPALRMALEKRGSAELLYASCRRPPPRAGTRWLHNSALDSIRDERAGGASDGAGSTSPSMDTMRDRLDMLMAFTEGERNAAPLASTPEQEATLGVLRGHVMKMLERPVVQYGAV